MDWNMNPQGGKIEFYDKDILFGPSEGICPIREWFM
jgi:hypothetical protein